MPPEVLSKQSKEDVAHYEQVASLDGEIQRLREVDTSKFSDAEKESLGLEIQRLRTRMEALETNYAKTIAKG